MDRKVKQRILGVIVLIGLIVFLLPFFHKNNESSSGTSLVKAPPFPDQPVQVETGTVVNDQESIPTTTTSEQEASTQPADTIRALRPSVISSEQEVSAPANNAIISQSTASITAETADAAEVIAPTNSLIEDMSVVAEKTPATPPTPAMKAIQTEEPKAATHKPVLVYKKPVPTHFAQQGIDNLKNPSWVIQIGSFKNKANALRLANQLRANGYPAFVQKITTVFGANTRVFVGPETKRKAARSLAIRLEQDLHIHGIVVSYKPLQL